MRATLSAEVRVVLDLSPRVRAAPPDPTPRYVVAMLRLHAQELLTSLAAMLDALPKDDPGRRACQQCLDDVDGGVRGARAAAP
jgi:hypothetical protein